MGHKERMVRDPCCCCCCWGDKDEDNDSDDDNIKAEEADIEGYGSSVSISRSNSSSRGCGGGGGLQQGGTTTRTTCIVVMRSRWWGGGQQQERIRMKTRRIIVVTRSWWWWWQGGGGGGQQQGGTTTRIFMVMSSWWEGGGQQQGHGRLYGSHRERRGMYNGIIVIRMVPIGQYVIHCTRHTILTVTWHDINTNGRYCHPLSSVYQVICTVCHPCTRWSVPALHYHIKQSTASTNCIYIIGIIDGHGHEHKFNKEVDNPPSSNMPTHYYRFLLCTNTIIYNNRACHAIPHHHPFTTIDLIWFGSIRFDSIQPSSPSRWWRPSPPVTTDDDTDDGTPSLSLSLNRGHTDDDNN